MSRPCPKCRKKVYTVAEVDYVVSRKYDRRKIEFVIPKLQCEVCLACGFRVPYIDAKMRVDTEIRRHVGILTPSVMNQAWIDNRLGVSISAMAREIDVSTDELTKILTHQTLQSPLVDRRLREALGITNESPVSPQPSCG